MRKMMGVLAAAMLFAIAAGVITNGEAAPKYVKPMPLAEVVKTPVGQVKDTGCVPAPYITWGADMDTIYGNGNAKKTVAGSIFEKEGICIELFREDILRKQLEAYLSGRTPYGRGTLGQMNQALELLSRDPRTVPIVFHRMSCSAGGDVLVVKDNIKTLQDLKGKVIVTQLDGVHIDFLMNVLIDAGLTPDDVEIRYTENIVGIADDTPGGAFHDDPTVSAAFVLSTDAATLTEAKSRPGTEGHVIGAKVKFSTKTGDDILIDVYWVRSDYDAAHHDKVMRFRHGILLAEERVRELFKNPANAGYKPFITASAEMLFDSPLAAKDAEGLYGDGITAGFADNVKFFTDQNNVRNFDRLTADIQGKLIQLGLISKTFPLAHGTWDYEALKKGLTNVADVQVKRFNPGEVARIVATKDQQGTLKESELFSYEVYFEPQNPRFSLAYKNNAKIIMDAIQNAEKYGGAIITVKGHSNQQEYIVKKRAGVSDRELKDITQITRNLSKQRAEALKEIVIVEAKNRGIIMDPTQFTTIGKGIEEPLSGMCGSDPCPARSKDEWERGSRVVFTITTIEAESSAYIPLQ